MSLAQYGYDYAGINQVCGAHPEKEHPDTTMTDIYPVRFHDATVEPVTPVARYVLTTSK